MPGLTDLIAAARSLIDAEGATPAHVRRSISTAYYAVFHHVLSAGATRFLRDGKPDGAAFSILYRGFSHGRMRTVCQSLSQTRLGQTFARQFQRSAVSDDMRGFANSFLILQDVRHLADYDPLAEFSSIDARAFIDDAEAAIAAFDRAEPDEQDDVLALMLISTRGA